FVGYRGYEHNGTKPLFPFGYGLSYTTFKYANLTIKPADSTTKSNGLAAPLYQISFDVTNTGTREGADVAQVYVSDPQSRVLRPVKELKGFARINLQPGETKTSTITLDSRAFAYYDTAAKQWRTDATEYQILVGRSSQDIQLRGGVTPPAAATASANDK
ncbi:MAG: fibronectin type III-like domain-contianing protein, partial [Candidatus Acidiferrales bacterium]